MLAIWEEQVDEARLFTGIEMDPQALLEHLGTRVAIAILGIARRVQRHRLDIKAPLRFATCQNVEVLARVLGVEACSVSSASPRVRQ